MMMRRTITRRKTVGGHAVAVFMICVAMHYFVVMSCLERVKCMLHKERVLLILVLLQQWHVSCSPSSSSCMPLPFPFDRSLLQAALVSWWLLVTHQIMMRTMKCLQEQPSA